jgi:hypothetical protein
VRTVRRFAAPREVDALDARLPRRRQGVALRFLARSEELGTQQDRLHFRAVVRLLDETVGEV